MRRHGWLGMGLTILLAGCAADPGGGGDGCTTGDDCESGRCVDGVCVAPPDAGEGSTDGGGETDAGVSRDAGLPPMPDAGLPMTDSGVPPMDAGFDPFGDTDMDGISDFHEGRSSGTSTDTDGDGAPDYLDPDSDNDGILDRDEAGDADPITSPVDTDFDGVPDFRDDDSDGNGVPDSIEGTSDLDGDGRPAFRDGDNDGDGLEDVFEIGGDPSAPRDTDRNGVPDYNSIDSDGDTISDLIEALEDTDADGLDDRYDLDTDGDGIPDLVEAGDTDISTPPVDTDMDGIFDFRDTDSDGDGLSDAAERTAGTSPTRADTDGDGVSDLIEVGAGTDALDPSDSPRTRGDFVFVVPFMAPPDPTRDTLQFDTSLQKADVYFLVDTTGSMGGEIANLRSSLSSTIIPQVRMRIPDAWFGVGGFDDYPTGGYGSLSDGDRPLYLRQQMTSSTAAAQSAVNGLVTHFGVDYPESHIPALWGLASRGSLWYGPSYPSCAAGHRAGACFRPDAVPVIVVITDAISHNYPSTTYSGISPTPPSYAAAMSALNGIGARVVGVNSGGTDARDMLREFARQTSTLDASGSPNPFVIGISSTGTGLGTAAVDAIYQAAQVPLDVSARATDIVDPGETVDAVVAFLDRLETRSTPAPGRTCTTGWTTVDRPGIDADAYPDTFENVIPGNEVCFDIVPRMNTTVMPTLDPQLFRARIDVLGDGFTPLDDRVVFFLVPPRIPPPNE
ncbi:MAG: VWA domain-containing protein [Myxococcota bacterium]|nr:VWA domain-containing protein [Myxococcota bacterium]